MTLTSLGLALLAGAGTQRVLSVVSQRRPASARAPVAVAAVLAVAVLVEGSGFDLGGGGLRGPSHPAVPPLPTGYPAAPDPQLHLPLTVAANRRYVLWSTNGFPRLVNGRGSFVPRSLERLTYELRNFPDRASADLVRATGVKLVVLHPNLAHGTPWAGAASRGVKGLGLLRRARGGVVLYGVASPR
jgi:hypothetical protein